MNKLFVIELNKFNISVFDVLEFPNNNSFLPCLLLLLNFFIFLSSSSFFSSSIGLFLLFSILSNNVICSSV